MIVVLSLERARGEAWMGFPKLMFRAQRGGKSMRPLALRWEMGLFPQTNVTPTWTGRPSFRRRRMEGSFCCESDLSNPHYDPRIALRQPMAASRCFVYSRWPGRRSEAAVRKGRKA